MNKLNMDRVAECHELAKKFETLGFFRNCLNCSYWVDEKPGVHPEGCDKYKRTPPARVIVAGCPEHTDIIPF